MPAGVLMSRFFEPCKKVNGRSRPSIAWPEKTATKIIVRFNHSWEELFPCTSALADWAALLFTAQENLFSGRKQKLLSSSGGFARRAVEAPDNN